jgi:hypothetical protein
MRYYEIVSKTFPYSSPYPPAAGTAPAVFFYPFQAIRRFFQNYFSFKL